MKLHVVLGVLLVSAAFCYADDESGNFYEDLLREVKKQQKELEGKNIGELASKFINDARSVGKELVGIFRDAVAVNNGQALETSKTADGKPKSDKDKSVIELLTEIVQATAQANTDAQATNKASRRKRAAETKDVSALLQQLLSNVQSVQHGGAAEEKSSDSSSSDGASQSADGSASQSAADGSSYAAPSPAQAAVASGATASTRIGAPAPIVLIPGPPGKPGLPGVPGLPGKPGKIPNFRGLKAIITTRVAELLAFLAFVFVAMILKFLGLLGLLLGLVLPIYGKLKSAGAVVPAEIGGGAPGAVAASAPAGSYQQSNTYARRKRSAPMEGGLFNLDRLSAHVMRNVDDALAKFA